MNDDSDKQDERNDANSCESLSAGSGTARRFGLGVRVHRFVVIVATMSGFFAGVLLGHQLFGVWGEVLGAFVGVLVSESVSRFLIPAICPDCGQRADCLISPREVNWHGDRRSANVIRYHCRSCGFRLPQPVTTPAQLAAAGLSAIRAARFAQIGFTLMGCTMATVAAALSAHQVAVGDFRAAGIGAAVTAFALLFTFIARRAVSGFATAIRRGTHPLPSERDSNADSTAANENTCR